MSEAVRRRGEFKRHEEVRIVWAKYFVYVQNLLDDRAIAYPRQKIVDYDPLIMLTQKFASSREIVSPINDRIMCTKKGSVELRNDGVLVISGISY